MIHPGARIATTEATDQAVVACPDGKELCLENGSNLFFPSDSKGRHLPKVGFRNRSFKVVAKTSVSSESRPMSRIPSCPETSPRMISPPAVPQAPPAPNTVVAAATLLVKFERASWILR